MKTLKTMLLIGAGLVAFNTVSAQNVNDDDDHGGANIQKGENTWTFGPKVGMNISTFSTNSSQHRFGPAAGVFFVYSHREHFGVAGDLLYSYKGSEWETQSGNLVTKRSTQLSYIEMPVQGMYFFCSHSKFRPKVGFGPYMQLLVDGEEQVKVKPTGDADPISETEGDIRSYQTFDWGLVGSAGFNWEFMDDTWLNMDVRYGHGFSDVLDQNGMSDVKNRNWAVHMGIGFPLNRTTNGSYNK